jgi:ATP-GRASP peptide maturase of grasp-with-spasm system
VIIVFSRLRDPAANGVVPWLVGDGQAVLRINKDDPAADVIPVEMTQDDMRFRVGGRWYALEDVQAVWFRKGDFWFPQPRGHVDAPGQEALSERLNEMLKKETFVAKTYFHHLLGVKGVRVLGNPILGVPNKLVVLQLAQSLGLRIPAFEVVNYLSESHRRAPADYVTKAIGDGIYLWDFEGAGRGYFSYTEELGEVLHSATGTECLPLSLIQKKIRKRFELRIFYLDGTFFGSAIYSQADAKTAVDMRKYNFERPNRNVPFLLPETVAEQLRALFHKLELNTGSVDMIVDENGDFVFLEINPFGQYSYLSNACNLDLDRVIARWLINGAVDVRVEAA